MVCLLPTFALKIVIFMNTQFSNIPVGRKNEPLVVDVRTPEEYAFGHVPGSINIPLHEIPQRLEEIHSINRPLLLCCASGNRSGQATAYLRSQGIECENGGSWLEVRYALVKESSGCCA